MAEKRRSFTIGEKRIALEIASATNNCEAARRLSVSEKLIRYWRKAHDSGKWDNVHGDTRAIGRGAAPKFPALERELLSWIEESRAAGKAIVFPIQIRSKALELAKEDRFNIPAGSFVASPMWCSRFTKRHGLSLRCRAALAAQRLPEDLEDKLTGFQRLTIQKRKGRPHSLQQIGNMDESAPRYDMPKGRSVARKGDKSIVIETTGHEEDHLTVALACLADGTKLPPVVILKRKTMPKDRVPSGVIVSVHQKGWVDEAGLADWIETVWSKQLGCLLKTPSLLVWDSFRPPMSESIKRKLCQLQTDTATTPEGLTPMVQPLDVSVTKPFRDSVRRRWTAWMDSGECSLTPGAARRKPSITLMCTWVKAAWEEIKVETIVKSFKKCGTSNAMDGTGVNALWVNSESEEDSSNCEDPFADIDEGSSEHEDTVARKSEESDHYSSSDAKCH